MADLSIDIEAALDPPQRGQVVDILGRIKDLLDTLSPAERRVGAAVLADVRGAVEESSASLAQRADVSEPSVTRFCRAIGCRGVRDFKLRLAQSLVVGDLHLNADAPAEGVFADTPPYWQEILSDAHGALQAVERQVTPDAIRSAAEAVVQARQVVTFGLGGSAATLAEETQFRLFRYGVRVAFCSDPYYMRMTTATLGAEDVVILISASGKTEEAIEAAALARGYGVKSIGISPAGTALAEVVDLPLTVAIPESQDTLTPTSVRFAYLAIIDLVSAATAYALGPQARESLRRIRYTMLNHRASNGLEPLGD